MLVCQPIAYIHCSRTVKFAAPSQPQAEDTSIAEIELLPEVKLEHALRDLEGFERIWLIWWFHRNSSWRPMVLPPRGKPKRRGLFATRSPHRPNPIGISSVPLIKIVGRKLYVSGVDLIDGTPILDIKPYISEVDSFPDASCGWLEEIKSEALAASYTVHLSDQARQHIEWLKNNFAIDFMTRAFEILSHDPFPHRTRRISRTSPDRYRMACGGWRVQYCIHNTEVHIDSIHPGYPVHYLTNPKFTRIPDREAQIEFLSFFRSLSLEKPLAVT